MIIQSEVETIGQICDNINCRKGIQYPAHSLSIEAQWLNLIIILLFSFIFCVIILCVLDDTERVKVTNKRIVTRYYSVPQNNKQIHSMAMGPR